MDGRRSPGRSGRSGAAELTREGGLGVLLVPPRVLSGASKPKELIPSIGEEIMSCFCSSCDAGGTSTLLMGLEIDILRMSLLAFGVVSAGLSATEESLFGTIVLVDEGVMTSLRRKLKFSTGEMAEVAIGVAAADLVLLSFQSKNLLTVETMASEGEVTSLVASCGGLPSPIGKVVISFNGEFFGVIRRVALGFDGALIDSPRTNFCMLSFSDFVRE